MANTEEIKKQVEARALAEAENAKKKIKANNTKSLDIKKLEISDSDILAYLNENRLGDAKLYARLHRGQIVYVKYWDRFLVWAGHHWQEDDFDTVYRLIDDVCQLYLALAEKNRLKPMRKQTKK